MLDDFKKLQIDKMVSDINLKNVCDELCEHSAHLDISNKYFVEIQERVSELKNICNELFGYAEDRQAVIDTLRAENKRLKKNIRKKNSEIKVLKAEIAAIKKQDKER